MPRIIRPPAYNADRRSFSTQICILTFWSFWPRNQIQIPSHYTTLHYTTFHIKTEAQETNEANWKVYGAKRQKFLAYNFHCTLRNWLTIPGLYLNNIQSFLLPCVWLGDELWVQFVLSFHAWDWLVGFGGAGKHSSAEPEPAGAASRAACWDRVSCC